MLIKKLLRIKIFICKIIIININIIILHVIYIASSSKYIHVIQNPSLLILDILNYLSIIFLACRKGWYGVNCSQQCAGQCRDNTTCNHVTGHCERGCASGWTGIFCNRGTEKIIKIKQKKNN